MKVVGLCGGSGSGKGTVSSFFACHGIPSIDTDAVYRDITSKDSPCLRRLSSAFGKEIISDDGSLNRSALAKIVFTGDGADERLALLNKIAHSHILDETRTILTDYKEQGIRAAIVDAPLLFESGFDSECDIIVAVIADREARIKRIIERDSLDREAAEARINSQIADSILASRSDYVIENNSCLTDLKNQVDRIANLILDN